MNLKLFPNEVKVDFIIGNKELFRISDEIKQISFNKSGSLVGIATKQNKFYIYDYFGRNLICSILYYYEKKYKIKNFCFNETNNLYIAYEYNIQENVINSGIKEINLKQALKTIKHYNINNKDEYIIQISEEEKSDHQIFNEIINSKIFEILFEKEEILICGNNPLIYNLNTKNFFYFMKQELISLLPYTVNTQKQKDGKDVQIFIDNHNEKNLKNKEKKEEINPNNHHFIIPNNNADLESVENTDKKNEVESLSKNNKESEYIDSNNNIISNDIILRNNDVIKNEEEIKQPDINNVNNNDIISNNIDNNLVNNKDRNKPENESNNNIEIKIPKKHYNPYSIFIRYGYNSSTFYFIVKELYIFLILHLKKSKISEGSSNETEMIIEEKVYPTLDEIVKSNESKNSYSYKQLQFLDFIKETLNDAFYVSSIFNLNMNGEIIHVELNIANNLILINSTDRVVRLFEIINDSIILQKEYYDSVNKRKYTNCYFYTYKLKSGIQDLILMALNDANGLEFCFIDIVTGNIIKKLETFKYAVQDFICHYLNHFSILIISGKKIFCISGAMVNQLDCLAPGLKLLEENVEYIEEESFYDNFDEKMKKQIQMQNNHEEKIEDIFAKRNKKEENIFIKVDYDNEIKTNDSVEREKSINELKELFAYVGQQIQ